MRLSQLCFAIGSLTAVAGIGLGIYMGIAQDHTLVPVHVHLNLIGWVSLFLIGLYYHTRPASETTALARFQVGAVAAGYLAFTAGLASLLAYPSPLAMPMTVTGALLVGAGMLVFAVIVWRDAWSARATVAGLAARHHQPAE